MVIDAFFGKIQYLKRRAQIAGKIQEGLSYFSNLSACPILLGRNLSSLIWNFLKYPFTIFFGKEMAKRQKKSLENTKEVKDTMLRWKQLKHTEKYIRILEISQVSYK